MSKYTTGLKGGIFMMLVSTLFFSFKPIFGRIAIENGLLPEPLVTIRLMIALPLFIGTVILFGKTSELKLPVKDFLLILAMSVTGFAGAMLFSFKSIQYLGASISTLVIFVFPAITMVLAYFYFGEKITKLKALSLAVSFAGILLVALPASGNRFSGVLFFDLHRGLIYALGCAVCWAFTQISMQKISRRTPPIIVATYSTGTMIIFFILINGMPSMELSKPALIAVVLLGTVCWYIPFLLAVYAIKIIGASHSAIVQSIGPGLTVFAAWAMLEERLVALQIAGMLMVIIAVYLLRHDTAKVEESA